MLPDCDLWTGPTMNSGYGMVRLRGKTITAHKAAWMRVLGAVPMGFDVCHVCDTPLCVNVNHLFLGTRRDNVLDMAKKGRAPKNSPGHNLIKTHCSNGHEFTPANTIRNAHEDGGQRRRCRACRDASNAKHRSLHPKESHKKKPRR